MRESIPELDGSALPISRHPHARSPSTQVSPSTQTPKTSTPIPWAASHSHASPCKRGSHDHDDHVPISMSLPLRALRLGPGLAPGGRAPLASVSSTLIVMVSWPHVRKERSCCTSLTT